MKTANMILAGGIALLINYPLAGATTIKPIASTLVPQPEKPQALTITGFTPETPDVVTGPDGTATVNFTVSGTGSGTCDLMIMNGQQSGAATAQVTPQSGFPKTIPVKFARPGVVGVNVYGIQCTGQAKMMYNVKPHPDYPCSLYPGFKKELYFNNPNAVICTPAVPPASNPDASRFYCGNGLVFTNAGNYIFGCLPPGIFSH